MYAIQFVPDFGLLKGIWYGVFHSVSAFCNAGIDILGEDSLAKYVTNPLINITTMLLITLGGIGFICKEIGVPYVVVKTKNERHAEILKKIGADAVISPEKEIGIKLARNLMKASFADWIALSPDYSIAESEVPKAWIGKSLKELDIRKKYGVIVVGIKWNSQVEVNPDPDEKLKKDMILILVGANHDLRKIG